jgi:hypothetical protein
MSPYIGSNFLLREAFLRQRRSVSETGQIHCGGERTNRTAPVYKWANDPPEGASIAFPQRTVPVLAHVSGPRSVCALPPGTWPFRGLAYRVATLRFAWLLTPPTVSTSVWKPGGTPGGIRTSIKSSNRLHPSSITIQRFRPRERSKTSIPDQFSMGVLSIRVR